MIGLPTPDEIAALSPDELQALALQLGGLVVLVAARLAIVKPANGAEPPWLDQETAAASSGVAIQVVRHLTRTNRVRSVKEGKRRLVDPASLAAYVKRCAEIGVPLRRGPRL